MIQARSRIFRCLALPCAFLLLAVGCEDTGEGDGSQKVTCGKGQVIQYNQTTGDPFCVTPEDGGSIGDATIGEDSGGGQDVSGLDVKPADAKDTVTVFDGGGEEDVQTGPVCEPTATGLDKWWNCAPKPSNPGALLHGKACTKDEECLYGHCMFGMPLAGYDKAVGFCTKNCKYPAGGEFTSCKSDNAKDPDYDCVLEKSKNSGNDLRSAERAALLRVFGTCAKNCKTDSECQAWNPAMPVCIKPVSYKYVSFGTVGVCAAATIK